MQLPDWLAETLQRDPVRFVDVGARGGWQRKWRAWAPYARFIGVEPDAGECARLRASARPNEIYLETALHHRVGEVTLYHCDPPARTSIYRPDARAMARLFGNPDATKVVRTETLPVTTFDLAIEPLGVGRIDFVKLDTQGSELDVLRGAERSLSGPMMGIEAEVEFTALYEGQALFHDLAAFVAARGFEFVDFPSTYSSAFIRFGHRGALGYGSFRQFAENWATLFRARGGLRHGQRLVYADAVFLREPDAWVTAVLREGERARGQGLRGFAACCVVGYWEHATEVAERLRDADLLSARELDSASAFIARSAATWRRAAEDATDAARRLARHLRSSSGR